MRKFKTKLAYIPAIIWMIVIFCFSHQSASQSSNLSSGIVAKLIDFIKYNLSININEDLLHTAIRKGAHFTEYLILAVFVMFGLTKNNVSKPFLKSVIICALYAMTDEFHQLFVDGRSGRVFDVMVDTSGAVLGTFIFCFTKKCKLFSKF